MLHKISLSTFAIKNADVNKDGKVNTIDAAMIDGYVAGDTEETGQA